MNRLALLASLALLAACPGGGDSPPNRLWLDAQEGATPVLSVDHPPRF